MNEGVMKKLLIEEQIAKVLSRAAMIDPAQVRPEAKLSELGIDSMTRIECVFSLEDAFHVEISESELSKLQTVQDVINTVSNALAVAQ